MNFEEIPSEILRVGKLFAEAKAYSEMMGESKHSVLAKEASLHDGSEAEKNRIARCSDKYKTYLASVQTARQTELELRYELDSLNAQFAYFQAMNANKRAEINLK